MREYVFDRVAIPVFIVRFVASWAFAFSLVLLAFAVGYAFAIATDSEVFAGLPSLLRVILNIVGAYAGFGCFGLYAAMWVYWFKCEAGIGSRIVWALVLLFGLIFGSLIYFWVVWLKGSYRVEERVIASVPRRTS